ncbi:extracellular solute-binding protein [Rhizobium lentis]|uniref:Extracellular solute-binding protein n=1 Tax=Rhizobium lentis TaxID=1138194 RepID=A0ABS7I912_9HYPH|nr:extracellular solute-binding protein [Rhizobium lentis]MBX5088327.1 extracellular solute-binding protein [Rhizobium lentis]
MSKAMWTTPIAVLMGTTAMATSALGADLTVGAFGGLWEQSLRTCVIEPFEKETGKSVEVVLGSPVQWINQIAANPSQPPVDIVFTPTEQAYEMIDKGLADEFTKERVTVLPELNPDLVAFGEGYGVVFDYGAMGVIYNSKTVKTPINTWDDFFNGVENGDFTATIPSISYPSALSASLWNIAKTSGGDEKNAQPGLDRVKNMMQNGELDFWSDPNQVLNALASGEIDAAMYWDGRSWGFIVEGNNPDFKYVTPKPGGPAALTWIQKVKNSDEIGWKFVNIALGAEAQGCFASKTRYGIANLKAKFDPASEPMITKYSDLTIPPYREINKSRDPLIEAWNKQIGR